MSEKRFIAKLVAVNDLEIFEIIFILELYIVNSILLINSELFLVTGLVVVDASGSTVVVGRVVSVSFRLKYLE